MKKKYVQLFITLPDDWEGPFDPSHILDSLVDTYRNDPVFDPSRMPIAKPTSMWLKGEGENMKCGPTVKFRSNFPLAHTATLFP